MCCIAKVILISILCSYALVGRSQQKETSQIKARVEIHTDRILLRWIPGDAESWELLNRYGVRLERLTVARSGAVLEHSEHKLLAEGLKPQETESFKQLALRYPMAAVVAQAIFGEDFDVSLGESPISKAIALDEMRQQRYLFSLYAADLCFPAAKEAGWGWEDRDVRENERYLYRITSLVPEKKKNIRQGAVLAISGDTVKLVRPIGLSVEFSESGAQLTWDYHTLSYLYSSYFIEKSEDGKNFLPISDLPVTRVTDTDKNPYAPITYLDSIPLGKTIYYRVAGVTPFGSKGAYSEVVSGIAYPTLKAVPLVNNTAFDKTGGANIFWQFDDTQQDLITGFNILHSKDDKHYVALAERLDPQKREYHITTIGQHIYYKIEAKAKQGASTYSFPVLIQPIDSVPPVIPQGLTAEVDSLGAVHLSWQANTDPDIYGYRLYRGQTKGEELIPITDLAIRETSYTDSVNINNLNSRVYYALTALDRCYNQSEQSETIEVMKPNTIPPATPVITRAVAEEGKNVIEWVAGEDAALAGFFVIRTEIGERNNRVEWRIDDPMEQRYEDKEAMSGETYHYQVSAFSTGGLASDSSLPVLVKSFRKKSDTRAAKLILEVLPEGIAVKWNVALEKLISVNLYKMDDTNTKFLYRENLPVSGEIIDREIFQGRDNEYMLLVKIKGQKPITLIRKVLL